MWRPMLQSPVTHPARNWYGTAGVYYFTIDGINATGKRCTDALDRRCDEVWRKKPFEIVAISNKRASPNYWCWLQIAGRHNDLRVSKRSLPWYLAIMNGKMKETWYVRKSSPRFVFYPVMERRKARRYSSARRYQASAVLPYSARPQATCKNRIIC